MSDLKTISRPTEAEASAAILSSRWYAVPNDLIGGWCVMTADVRPSEVDLRRGEIFEVGCFLTQRVAEAIAHAHNSGIDLPAAGSRVGG